MSEKTELKFSREMPCDAEFLFNWHNSPGVFSRLLPGWEPLEVLSHPSELSGEKEVELKVTQGPVSFKWKLKHDSIKPPFSFEDYQVSGPFRYWRHKHEFKALSENSSELIENLSFQSPVLNKLISNTLIKDKLKRLFDYRFRITESDIKNHYKYKEVKAMKILVTGSTGLVGKPLCDFLSSGGHDIHRLVRSHLEQKNDILWQAPQNSIEEASVESSQLEGFDVIIHLAGENIANKRWTKKQKDKIYNSRILSTKFLSKMISELEKPPETFICGSAIGFYGDRGDELLEESGDQDDSFLAKTCKDWEDATKAASEKGIRVVNARTGIVLDPKGGALAKMLPIFQLATGGILGNGKQWMSWITIDDMLGAFLHCIMNKEISGPVNFVSPIAVTNNDFTKVLAKVLNRPAIFPAPAFALKLALGEMADALLLSSTRVKAGVLEKTNYDFSFPDLEDALKHILGK